MDLLHISYSVYIKNAKRGSANYYCRVRENQKTVDVNLHTTDKAKADAYVRLRRSEVERYNDYVVAGEEVPEDLSAKIVHAVKGARPSTRRTLTIRETVDSWENDMRIRGLSERTITMYCKTVGYMFDVNMGVDELNVSTVRSAVASQSHIQASTRHSYFVAVGEYIKYVSRLYGVSLSLLDEVPKVKVVHKDQPWWTITEIRQIIEAVSCKSTEMERCYKAFFWFLALTGARQGEAGKVEWGDINDGYVTFRSTNVKTGETRVVPLEWRLLEMLGSLPKKSKYVFADIHPSQAGRFNVLSKAVRKCGARWGGLHSFRRSCSMYMYEKADDVKAVADMLGHGPVTMMKHYVASRSKRELSDLVGRVFSEENQIPDPMDRLREEGFV